MGDGTIEFTAFENLGRSDPNRYKEMLRMFLESVPSSVLLVSREMKVVLANRNFVTKSLRSHQDVIGEKLEKVLPAAIIEHIDIANRVREVFTSSIPVKGERLTYRAPGIPIRTYYYTILPFEWQGTVENVLLLMEDVTEQVRLSEEVRRVERHLASVVESARDVVLSTDSHGTILTWNTAAERLTGFSSAEVRGKTLLGVLMVEESKGLKEVLERLQSAKSPQTGEWELITKAGKTIPISWSFSPMKDEMGRPVGIVAVGRDLSEHRELELRLLQSQKLASLGVMAGGIAHEIRNPLAVCSSAAQFLNDPGIDPKFRQDCIERIEKGINKASSIIENLLRFARPSSTTEMKSTDLIRVIRDSLQLVSNQANILKIAVSTDFNNQDIVVYGNPNLLQQMFLNLFLNACNAMPAGGTLSITARRSSHGAQVAIQDTGCGISQKNLEKIFDPFFTLSPVGKGTGLGLSICYSIVQQHLGTLDVQSIEGKGTIVTVQFPVL